MIRLARLALIIAAIIIPGGGIYLAYRYLTRPRYMTDAA